jgi:diadenosine tetraphosphate (Ap4A) HIT family hydrolase
MPTLIHHRVQAAREGANPTVICKMPSGWAVLGDRQFIPGYALLLPDPVVNDLNELKRKERTQFLNDMALIGDALLELTDSYRINYEILGNYEPALHAHIFPRYMSEPEKSRQRPVWMSYEREELDSQPFNLERDRELMTRIANFIQSNL